MTDSADERYAPGDRVVLTGWRVGEVWWGGYASKARVKADWLSPLPDGLTTRQAMAVGTAGFTAMMAVDQLERHGLHAGDPVLVTGAAGGVGSTAVGAAGQARLRGHRRPPGGSTPRATRCGPSARRRHRPRRDRRGPRPARCCPSAGRAASTPSAARRWPTCSPRCATAARWRPAGSPGATTCRRRSCPSCSRHHALRHRLGDVPARAARPCVATPRPRCSTPAALESMTSEVSLEELPALADEILAGRTAGARGGAHRLTRRSGVHEHGERRRRHAVLCCPGFAGRGEEHDEHDGPDDRDQADEHPPPAAFVSCSRRTPTASDGMSSACCRWHR